MQIDTSLLTITNLSMEAIDEWVCFTIKFIYRGPERPDLSDDRKFFNPQAPGFIHGDRVDII